MGSTLGITSLTAAELSNAAYPNEAPPPGWVAEAAYSKVVGANSFTTFVNTATKQIVIAFKGTDFGSLKGGVTQLYSDLENDGGAAWESIKVQFAAVLTAIQSKAKFAAYNIMTDGHSLGGGMAQTAALEYKLSGYGQNSLPVSSEAIEDDFQIAGLGGFANAAANWSKAGYIFSEANTDGDPATAYYANGAYLSLKPVPLSNQWADLETFGLENGSIALVALAAYEAHKIGTVIKAESDASLAGDAAIYGLLYSNNSKVDAAILNDELSVSSTGVCTATGPGGFPESATLVSTSANKYTYAVSLDGKPNQTDIITASGSNIKINTEIDNDAIVEVNDTLSATSIKQEFTFETPSGTLEIVNPSDFTGTIFDFARGDTIDLTDIGLGVNARLSANNVLTVEESSGDSVTVNFDPSADYTGYAFIFNADSNGGTEIGVASDTQHVTLLGANALLLVENPTSFNGTISGFTFGDTIDLSGIGAVTSAKLGADNLLTVQESDGKSVTVRLDPSAHYSDDAFIFSSDGNGGTDIGLVSDTEHVTLPGASALLLVENPAKFTGTISGFTFGDTIDLAGIGTATGATLGSGNVLSVPGGKDAASLNLDSTENFHGATFVALPDGHGGTDVSLGPNLTVDGIGIVATMPIPISAGDTVTVTATGVIDVGNLIAGVNDAQTPEGQPDVAPGTGGLVLVDESLPAFSLIGSIDGNTPFEVGSGTSIHINGSGNGEIQFAFNALYIQEVIDIGFPYPYKNYFQPSSTSDQYEAGTLGSWQLQVQVTPPAGAVKT